MTKTQRLNELFEEWKAARPDESVLMCLDGIVSDGSYERASPRILFIAKEPNHDDERGFDFRDWWSTSVKYGFANRLCEWTYGIRNGFPPLAEFDAAPQARLSSIRSIAFMNLKKVGGRGTAALAEVRAVTIRDREFLRRQIEIIEPEVIVGGLRGSGLWSDLWPGVEFTSCGYDIGVARCHGSRVVDFYHPSYRVPRAMSYALLGQVWSSAAFRNLS